MGTAVIGCPPSEARLLFSGGLSFTWAAKVVCGLSTIVILTLSLHSAGNVGCGQSAEVLRAQRTRAQDDNNL